MNPTRSTPVPDAAMPPAAVAAAVPGRVRSHQEVGNWIATLAATVVATGALDATATATGVGLAASGLLSGMATHGLLALLAVSYLAWGLGMNVNLRANRALLATTGKSTCGLSKAAYDVTRRRTRSARAPQLAAGAGYVAWNLAFDVPYYTGAFGAAAVSDAITSEAALVFLSGANVGAALYEYGIARLTGVFLRRRGPRP